MLYNCLPRPKGGGFLFNIFSPYLCYMQTVLITGGTGMVGQALTSYLLARGYQVIILSRSVKKSNQQHLSYAFWDIDKQFIDSSAINAADIIVHLAGESVANKRWTAKRKQEIIDSRVKSGALLVKALNENKHKVKTVIAASAIGWYGPDTANSLLFGFNETDPFDNSYLGSTCKQWEGSVKSINELGIRLVTLRIGIVFNKKGGALAEFIKPAKFGMATILGTGKQIVSWIHQDDLCKMIVFAAENETVKGVYNAVAPNPINNKDLVNAIASTMHKFHITLNVPVFVLKIMLGEMSIEVLKSANVSSNKIESAGFVFDYPNVNEALKQIL